MLLSFILICFIVIRPELSHIKGQKEREVALRQEQPYGYEYKVSKRTRPLAPEEVRRHLLPFAL